MTEKNERYLRVHPSEIGPSLGRGEHMECFIHATDSNRVIKLAHSNETWVERRRRRCYSLVRRHLSSENFVSTLICLTEEGTSERYCEIQKRVFLTVQDVCLAALNKGDLDTAKRIVLQTFEFEENILWTSGLAIQDTKSLFENLEFRNEALALYDFCGVEDSSELAILFFQGPWRIFRIEGLVHRLNSSLGEDSTSASHFFEWFREIANKFYRLEVFRAAWCRAIP